MKSNDQHDSRSEHARNESRDSEGRFSKDQSTNKSQDTSHMGHGRGTKDEKESLNPHDKMTSKDKMDNNHKSSHEGRGSNAKNEPRDSHGRFESEK